jgi:hypothetical protein
MFEIIIATIICVALSINTKINEVENKNDE